MIITKEQQAELLEASKPLITWINENCHQHCAVVVSCSSAELLEGITVVSTEECFGDGEG